MDNDRGLQFWLALGSFLCVICSFLFVGVCVLKEQFVFHKGYCLALIPAMIYFLIQFAINYSKIIEK